MTEPNEKLIGTEFIEGQGLGNQLLCYVSARCIAQDNGCAFGCINPAQVGNVFHSQKGMYFMDLDLGKEIAEADRGRYRKLIERDDRLYMGNSIHDMTHGCYISGADERFFHPGENTILYGNMQAEAYFGKHREEVREWLKVHEDADSHEYTQEDLCIINVRGGEYTNHPELYLDRTYFLHAVQNMKKIRKDLRFMVVTEDVEAARKILPEFEIHHFDMGKDYVTIKNARYVILSNSSFAILPVFTSRTIRAAIAPKYWARHNISDGFWSSEQNIYSFLQYQDRSGRLFTAEECKRELEAYKKTSSLYARRNQRPGKGRTLFQILRRKGLYGIFYGKKILRSLERRTGLLPGAPRQKGSQ